MARSLGLAAAGESPAPADLLARFAPRCEAFFGYCGDARAEEVDLANGFRKTGHPHLLVNFHKPLHEVMQRALIAKAAAIGPF